MKKITRTIKKYVVEITMYVYDREALETTICYAYGMSSKELMRHFEKKYASVGKVVSVKVKKTENIKVSLDVETFVSLAGATPDVNESLEMLEPIVDGE
jgi:uncharacterized protein YbbC (DUF1343 family)